MSNANDGHGIEVLHMAHVIQDMLHQYVLDTVWVDAHPEIKESIEAAADSLAAMYQVIGNSMPD